VHRTRRTNPNTHETKLIEKTNKRRVGKKVVEVTVEDQFGFRNNNKKN